MSVKTNPTTAPQLYQFLQCGRKFCGYILNEEEREWVPGGSLGGRVATCPGCGYDAFYRLNASGQITNHEHKIKAEDFQPRPRMGAKRKEAMMKARVRAWA